MIEFYSALTNSLLTFEDVKSIIPEVSRITSESELNSRGVFTLQYKEPPVPAAYQQVIEISPTLIGGRYFRNYAVIDLFPSPIQEVDEFGNIVTVSVQEQKERYDAQRLVDMKASLKEEVEQAYEDSIQKGFVYTFPDSSVGTIPLDNDSSLTRILTANSGTGNKTIITQEGTKTLTSTQYTTAMQSSNSARVTIDVNKVEKVMEVDQLMSLSSAVLFEAKEGFPVYKTPETITLLVDVDGMDFDYVNNQDDANTKKVGIRPTSSGKGSVNLLTTWLGMDAKRIISVGGVAIGPDGLVVEVRSSTQGNRLCAKVYFKYNSVIIDGEVIEDGLPLSIPNIVVGY